MHNSLVPYRSAPPAFPLLPAFAQAQALQPSCISTWPTECTRLSLTRRSSDVHRGTASQSTLEARSPASHLSRAPLPPTIHHHCDQLRLLASAVALTLEDSQLHGVFPLMLHLHFAPAQTHCSSSSHMLNLPFSSQPLGSYPYLRSPQPCCLGFVRRLFHADAGTRNSAAQVCHSVSPISASLFLCCYTAPRSCTHVPPLPHITLK